MQQITVRLSKAKEVSQNWQSGCESVEATSHNLAADAAIEAGVGIALGHLERWHRKPLWEKFRETLARLYNLNLPTTYNGTKVAVVRCRPSHPVMKGSRQKVSQSCFNLKSIRFSHPCRALSALNLDVTLPFSSCFHRVINREGATHVWM